MQIASVLMSNSKLILVLVRDLMFSSRISATARAENAQIKVVRDATKIADEEGARLIVDLNQPDALEQAIAWKQKNSGDVVGFVSHVDKETIERAREAGIHR